MNDDEIYREWIAMYDPSLKDTYQDERKELQKAAMLIRALKTELKSVQDTLEVKLRSLRDQLSQKDELEDKMNSFKREQYETGILTYIPQEQSDTSGSDERSNPDSPDIFHNNTPLFNTDYSVNDIDTKNRENREGSPTLSVEMKKSKRVKCERIKKDILNNSNKENSILVDCTPEPMVRRNRSTKVSSKKSGFLFKKKEKNGGSTLTNLFKGISKLNVRQDETKLGSELVDDDLTRIKQSDSEMCVTQILAALNDKSKRIEEDEGMDDSGEELDEFSKAILFDDSPKTASPKKKFKFQEPIIEPVVRGNARKLLTGFSCKECEEFYGRMNLSPEELKIKLDECSKHRFLHGPPEDTLTGIWNISIPVEKHHKK